ncbi:hypothetical protein QCA50_013819 [Cerrena zonata]|uniref:Uncharacterized protein n=1 Tax=Cerrena zonata TaxID=2478898 RepID=A0AAW0G0J5_9APHY
MSKSSSVGARSSSPLISISPGILLVGIIIFVTTIANVMTTAYNLALLRQLQHSPREYTYIGSDYPAELPLDIPSVGLELEGTEPHYALKSDADWKSIYPQPRMGFTSLGQSNRTFMVSMYHQLHCLDVIRVGFVVNGSDAYHHIEHCLRYLRQILLCKADTTLEVTDGERTDEHGRILEGASGLGMIHRCKDWTKVKRHLEDKDANLTENSAP